MASFLIPPLAAFLISLFTSPAGVSGAFLLLPFQMSVLGFTGPSVSPTNLVYNIVAIPSGVYRYCREGRMAWPLAWIIIAGTLPGVLAGAIIRVKYLPDPAAFKFFAGLVLLYLAGQLFYQALLAKKDKNLAALEEKFKQRIKELKNSGGQTLQAGLSPEAVVKTISFTSQKYEFEFWEERFSFNPSALFVFSLVVGVVGGTYGIGGGAIIAPFCAVFFGLPLYAVAGATLLGTFVTSIIGVAVYSWIMPYFAGPGMSVAPDWMLGLSFGAGGFLGVYCGARFQKFISEKTIRALLSLLIAAVALQYLKG
ncbi:MAG: sulfite exporter TauE/SafE family protein [Elusimicrobia bacterium]|nr:sulfite exporter TauE/SafE family protein [Elusimicrobiota bacterium]